MAQANNRGFNQDYSCANSREFLPYLLLVSHWMPEWIWAKQGRQMDNKTWSKIRQREQIQPVMRQFDVCSANQESTQENASWNFFYLFILWKHSRLSSVHRWEDKTRGQFFFKTVLLTAADQSQTQTLMTDIILIWLKLHQFLSKGC